MLKLAGSQPASSPAPAPTPTATADEPSTDDGAFGDKQSEDSASDKPFNDEPFDAGVETDEATDPKKFIEQLTGKLGQSLRKYNEEQGQPDFELEKFAINSLLSATHTSEMDENDQDDIIKKVKTAGNDDNSQDDNSNDTNDNSGDDSNDDDGFGGDSSDNNADDEADFGDVNEEKETPLFLDKPKKNNMFQPGSNDVLTENETNFSVGDTVAYTGSNDKWKITYITEPNAIGQVQVIISQIQSDGSLGIKTSTSMDNLSLVSNADENLQEGLIKSEKRRIFDKIKSKLHETFNQDDMETSAEPMIEPQVPTPVTKPAPSRVQPNIAPSRKNKPFLPMPDVTPDPKAIKEGVEQVYFNTYSGAVQAAHEKAEARGYTIDPESWNREITFGAGRPKAGQTRSHVIELIKDGKPQRKALAIQVYNRGLDVGNTYELNCYIS